MTIGSIYGATRPQAAGVTFTATSGGNFSTPGSIWLAAQFRTRGGLTLHSTPVQVTYTDGGKIICTVTSTAITTGERASVHAVVISGATSNSVAAMQRLAEIPVLATDQQTLLNLPITLELTRDTHLALGASVANLAALPAGSNRIHGMIRAIDTHYYRYDSGAGSWADFLPWSSATNGFTTYFGTSTSAIGGCHRSILSILDADVLPPPPYEPNNSDSTPIILGYLNGLVEDDGAQIEQDEPIGLTVRVGNVDRTIEFSGFLQATYLGRLRISDGSIDTSHSSVGVTVPVTTYTATKSQTLSNLYTPQICPRGYALLYKFTLKFRPGEIPGLYRGVGIKLYCAPQGSAGEYDLSGRLVGSAAIVAPDIDGDSLLRIYPRPLGVESRAGAATIKSYTFGRGSLRIATSLAADTAGQKIAMSGTTRGNIVVRQPAEALSAVEVVRAVVSTLPGEGNLSPWSSSFQILSGTATLQIGVTIPTTIRADYPDVIAGQLATSTALKARLYYRVGGTIYKLPTTLNIPSSGTVSLSVSSLTGAISMGSSVAPNADPGFSLFRVETAPTVNSSGSGQVPTGSYEFAVALVYEAGNTNATKISHSTTDGCMIELTKSLAESLQSNQIITTTAAPTASDGNIGDLAIVTSGTGAGNLYKKSNATIWTLLTSLKGDSGGDSFAVLTANFTQPASLGFVTVSVHDSSAFAFWSYCYMPNVGYYQVTDILSKTSMTLQRMPGTYFSGNGVSIPEVAQGTTVVANPGSFPGQNRVNFYIAGFPGPAGTAGANAYTQTTAEFIQPAAGSTVNAYVQDRDPFIAGMYVYVENGGTYQVTGSGTSPSEYLTLLNLANYNNSAQNQSIAVGSRVSVTGIAGANAYSSTTASFTQPAEGSTVNVFLQNNQWVATGMFVAIQGGGVYEVMSTAIVNNGINVRNPPGYGNSNAGSFVSSGAKVSPSGSRIAGAFTSTTVGFTMPSEGGNVSVSLGSNGWMGLNQYVLIEGAGTFQVVSLSSTTGAVLLNLTGYGNTAAGTAIATGKRVVPTGPKGAAGADGVSSNSSTILTGSFIQPAEGANVTATVQASFGFAVGQIVYIENGGYYQIMSRPDNTSLSVQNLTGYSNTAQGTTIVSGGKVGCSGPKGQTGDASTTVALSLQSQSGVPVTAANEIKLYNRSNGLYYRPQSSGTEVIIAATNVNQQFTKAQRWGVNSVSNSGTSLVIDTSLGNIFNVTLFGNVTTFTLSNLNTGWFGWIFITQDSTGGRTLTKPSSFRFSNGSGSTTIPINQNQNGVTQMFCCYNGSFVSASIDATIS